MALNHKNFAQTTLAAAITTTDGTSITVASEAGFPAVDFIISIDTECLLVTVVSGTTWTVTRGYESSTAATHTNGTAVYHDWSAGEADSTVHGPASSTDGNFALYDGGTGKKIKDGPALVTTVGATGDDTSVPTEQAVREAIAASAGLTNPLTSALNAGNQDISYLKLLKLNGEIDDGNSGTADVIDWNMGAAHKSTLTGNVTLAFTGHAVASLIPTMTGYTTPSGVASESGSMNEEVFPGWKVFDGNVSTQWAAPSGASWLQYQFSTEHIIVEYSITTGADTGYVLRSWTLKGSNNGTDWVTLDAQTNAFAASEVHVQKYFTIVSPASYAYYQLDVGSPGYDYAETAEWALYDTATLNPAAPCFLTLKLVQDATGGRTVTWPATVKGTPLYDLAANAVTNLLFYWDGTYYWLLNNNGKVAVPASAAAKGITGQWAADGSNFYYCSATDTWVRAALATWS